MKTKKVYFFFIALSIFQLFYLFYYRSGFNYEILINPFHINSARSYAVSEEILESNEMLNNNKLNDFKLSKKIKSDIYLYQRIVEYNYPKKIENDALYMFYLIDEKILNNCILFKAKKYLKLAKC